MADYALIRDEEGNVHGLWIGNNRILERPGLLDALLAKHNILDKIDSIRSGHYRVVRNTFDNAGGSFLMFGSALAPGE